MAKLIVGVNDLNTTHPELSKQALGWDPKSFTFGSKSKQKWICELSHEWKAEIKDRSKKNSGCPVCFGSKVLTGFNDLHFKYPEVAKEAFGWDPKKVRPGSHKKFEWKCSSGHIWKASPNHRTTGRTGCSICKSHGFNMNKESYLYLIFNIEMNMMKIGITNYPKRRFSEHKKSGWEVVDILGPKIGREIKNLESSIIKKLKENGINVGDSKNRFIGYTESWSKNEYSVGAIDDLLAIID